jgi:formate/nitrite transporter FocA (FNT family)
MVKPIIDLASPLAYTPAETAELICRAGVKKGRSRPDKVFLSGISGGCILAFGCAVSLTAMTAPWYQENAPGLVKLIGALVFPLGLVTVILTGADLFTSTNLVRLIMSRDLTGYITNIDLVHVRCCSQWKIIDMAHVTPLVPLFLWKPRRLSLCYGNNSWMYVAKQTTPWIFANKYFTDGGIFDSDPYREEIIAFTTKKQLVPEAHQIFLRAIGCNWLVCLSCFLGVQAKDLTSKVVGMWIPIFAFVALGFDHVVANMFFMPLGIWMGTPGLTIGLYIWKGKPATCCS